jgi:hypothetical protein
MTRTERYVAWVLRHGKIIWIIAVLLAIPATARTAMLYAHLKSDVQELLPRESASVLAPARPKISTLEINSSTTLQRASENIRPTS